MIQTKPKPRLSDGIVRVATHTVSNVSGVYGFMMKTGNSPVLILTADIGLAQGGSPLVVTIITGTVTNAVFNSVTASGGTIAPTVDTLCPPLYNTTSEVVIKGGILSNVTYAQSYNVALDISHNGWGTSSCNYRNFNSMGKFRNFGRLLRPNTNHVMMIGGGTTASASQNLNFYVEWIEGDYDYEDLMNGGRNK